MPTGARDNYHLPSNWRQEINPQELQVNHVQNAFDSFTVGQGQKSNGSNCKAGNYPIVQAVHTAAGSGAYLNTNYDIQKYAVERGRENEHRREY